MKAITAKIIKDRKDKKRLKQLKEARLIIEALARQAIKEEKLTIKCPHCGHEWVSLNVKNELVGAERVCEYCNETYEIIPNIAKKVGK